MIEIINHSLLFYFTVLSITSAALPTLLKPLWLLLFRRTTEENECLKELKSLKAEQNELSPMHNFATHSRLQRKINGIEDKYKEIYQERLNQRAALKLIITYGLQALGAIATLLCAFMFSHIPVVVLSGDLAPFSWFLGYPTGIENAISPHAWALITNSAIRTILKMF